MAGYNQRQVGNMNNANNNRKALGDIGNLVGALNARCNITNKDAATERVHANLQPADLVRGSTSNQQVQAEAVVARPDGKAEARAVWGSKQKRSMRRKAYATQNLTLPVPTEVNPSPSNADYKTAKLCKLSKSKYLTMTAALAARSESASRDIEHALPNIDLPDIGNQLLVAEYVGDIYKFYRDSERLSIVKPDYITKHVEVTEKMRGILVDWLIEVHLKFELMPETLYLTINIIDRYLSKQTVSRKNLQLVGVTAMLIACKYEEIWAPEVNDFVCISADEYTSQQIVAMERMILKHIKFNLTVPTPYVFLVRFIKVAGSDKEMENLAFFFTELSLSPCLMLKYSPSLLAAAAVYTALCTLKTEPCWTRLLAYHTGYCESDLSECAHRMVEFHTNAATSKLKTVYKKYSDPFFGSVAHLTPANLPAEDGCSCTKK